MFRGKVVNFPTGCTLSLSLFLFSVPVIIPAIDNLISELLQFRWCNGEGGGGGGGCWRSGKGEEVLRSGWKLYTWTHSVHVPRVYLGKVELTYWDRSDRLVAFMYPPCRRAAPKRSPSSFFFLFPLFTRHHPSFSFYILEPNTEDEKNWRKFENEIFRYIWNTFFVLRNGKEDCIECEL